MYADKDTVVYPTKIKHKVFMATCSLVEELKMKKNNLKKSDICKFICL